MPRVTSWLVTMAILFDLGVDHVGLYAGMYSLHSYGSLSFFSINAALVLKYGTDVIPNLQTVVWLGLPESFVHNLALSFALKHLCR